MVTISRVSIPDVQLLTIEKFPDERGFFMEVYRETLYEELGFEEVFVQDNYSFSKRGVIRGMHFQSHPGQAKLVTPLSGEIYDVFVDIRPKSPYFGKWGGCYLSSERSEQLLIPSGFAHGFAVVSKEVSMLYKLSSVFDPKQEKTFSYRDPRIQIEWPIANPILSAKDRNAPSFEEVMRK